MCQVINKKPDFSTYNWKIATWDLETSKDKNNKHIAYACGLAWNEYTYGEPKTMEEYEFLKTTYHLQVRKDYYNKIFTATNNDDMKMNGHTYGWIAQNNKEFAELQCKPNNQHAKIFKHLCKPKVILGS